MLGSDNDNVKRDLLVTEMFNFILDNECSLDLLISKFGEKINNTFVKIALSSLIYKKVLSLKNDLYYSLMTKEQGHKIINDTFGNLDNTTAKTSRYYDKYGFDALVSSVARQIDHEGKTVAVYNKDRLYLSRYVDFLDKATQYILWRESDNSIAEKKMEEIRKQHNINKK